MKKKILEKKLARLQAKKASLMARGAASQDVNEVRSINETIQDIDAEIEETQEELNAINAEEEETRSASQQTAPVNAQIVGAFSTRAQKTENEEEDITASLEYRKAFKAYVQRGVPMPQEFCIPSAVSDAMAKRTGEAASTATTGAAVPVTVMNEVINIVRKRYGNLYGKVRKLSVPGGVEIPIGALSAKLKWINESTVSPRQNPGNVGKITFNYHVGEIRVAQTFLSQILTLSDFETKVSEAIAIAYLEGMDEAIVNGSGDGSPLGILNDARVTNYVEMKATEMSDWKAWRKNFFAKLPLGYRAGEFIFPLSTVETYLETMSDDNNNPVFRQATGLEVGDGDAEFPAGRFFGRDIALVETDILPDFDTANAGDVIGVYWQPREYGINENFGFTMRRYFDEETNQWVDKCLIVADGKVINPTGYYLIKKKAN